MSILRTILNSSKYKYVYYEPNRSARNAALAVPANVAVNVYIIFR